MEVDKLKLKPEELKYVPSDIKIKYDKEYKTDKTADLIYGQERGIEAFKFGLDMNMKGYNIYFEGPTGVGKRKYVQHYLIEKSENEPVPDDWVYCYNFVEEDRPIPIRFKAGEGRVFKKDMEKYVEYVQLALKKTFSDEEVEKERTKITSEFEKQKAEKIKKLNLEVEEKGFEIQKGKEGVFMVPRINSKTLSKEEYLALPDEVKKKLNENTPYVQKKVYSLLTDFRTIEIENDKKLEAWQADVSKVTINQITDKLKEKYKRNKDVIKYLNEVVLDLLKNISEILMPKEVNPVMNIKKKNIWDKFKVNVFIDNSRLKGAPVIMDLDYSFENIFGKIEYENIMGTLDTDYTKIKAGILAKANGGYIVFQARELLMVPRVYDYLKKILKTEEIGLETPPEQGGMILLKSIKPMPIPINVKVIIIGPPEIYHLLMMNDPDFKKLFKVKTEFENESDITEENLERLTKFISSHIALYNLCDITEDGIYEIITYASKLAGDKSKISTNFAEIGRILAEASVYVKRDGKKFIDKDYIKKAYIERKERIRKYDRKYTDLIKKDVLLINTHGKSVGEINGLAVISIGDYAFGKPTKITANTYMGNRGIVNIEREIKMSGPSHNKGVLIIEGFLGERFGEDFPLSLTTSICFEQTYSGVDGDSATSTEIYVILSSLSEVPIKQGIAVTGSVNQKGKIQPIGGVNEKIEGFYEVCKLKGFNGGEGVIIPKQNVQNLSLNDEIVEAVKNNKFNIWAVETVDEGIEILTGVKAGEKNKNGNYPKGSINYLVYQKLKKFADFKENKGKKKDSKDKKEDSKK